MRAQTFSGSRSTSKSSTESSMKLKRWCAGPSEMIEVGPAGSPTCRAVGTVCAAAASRNRKSHTIQGSENP